MPRILVLLVALCGALPLHAGVIYSFATTASTNRGQIQQSGRVWADGERYRVELDPDGTGRVYDVAISQDNDRSAMLINRAKRAWQYRFRVNNTIRSSVLFQLPISEPSVIGTPTVTHHEEGPLQVAGYTAKKHVIRIAFRLGASLKHHSVTGDIEATVTLLATEQLPRLPLQRNVQTGYSKVDERIDDAYANVRGMVLGSEMTVTRTLEGGPAISEIVKTSVRDVTVADIPPEMFEVPAEYEHTTLK